MSQLGPHHDDQSVDDVHAVAPQQTAIDCGAVGFNDAESRQHVVDADGLAAED